MKKLAALLLLLVFVLALTSCDKGDLGSGEAKTAAEYISGGSSSGGSSSSSSSGSSSNPGGQAGVMTAGEWNDLDHWDFWNGVLRRDTIKTFPGVWGFYTDNRVPVVIRDVNNEVVHDARVVLTAGGESFSGVTDNSGRAEIMAGLFTPGYANRQFGVTVYYNGQAYPLGTIAADGSPITKNLPVARAAANTLDIQFVVDATGSMGDEISYLKNELRDVITRAGQELPGVQIRMGAVFYRDSFDTYRTRPFAFTTDVNALASFINGQGASGGGDFPEAVDEALDVAINGQQWSGRAVNRLLFLILDAPSHKSPGVLAKLKSAVTAAQGKGIRIIPVTASGIDRETEFLMRFLSIATNSTYVFITNHSGVGGPHLEPTVGSYTVEYLNNLLVRLIAKYGKG